MSTLRRFGPLLVAMVVLTFGVVVAACKDSAAPIGKQRLDEVPCWGECAPDSVPTLYASPSIFTLPPCYDQEGDLGTDVILSSGCPSSFDDGNHSFVVTYTSHVNPDVGQVAVSALYELTYSDATHYTARFMDTVLYGHDERVSHSTTIHLSAAAAGVRVRSFNLRCPSGTTSAYACWQQGGGAFDHDELHICIPNGSNGSWTDPFTYCALNLGDDAALPTPPAISYGQSTCYGSDQIPDSWGCSTPLTVSTNRPSTSIHLDQASWIAAEIDACASVQWWLAGPGNTVTVSEGVFIGGMVRVRVTDDVFGDRLIGYWGRCTLL